MPVPEPAPYERAVQEKRAARAERDLALLGKVNPLALEEFAALEERHAFLSTQLEDLKATRRDLLTVVREVDERIHDVFAAAFADTAREFEVVFRALFPGGEGKLILTDPDDLLATGVEVEARPPGKKIKRLSLLSGGERSLTAVALLVAIFRARPSPFYVLDEVEAALDDDQPRPAAGTRRGAAHDQPADRHHPPEAHDGDRRRALRHEHAGRRHHHGDQPADARTCLRATAWTARPAGHRQCPATAVGRRPGWAADQSSPGRNPGPPGGC